MPAGRITIPVSKEQDQATKGSLKRLEDDLATLVDNIYTDVPTISFTTGGSISLSTDVTIAHETGAANVTAGDFRVTTAGTNAASVVTIGGSQALTNKTVSGALPATGTVTAHSGTAIPAGGTAGAGLQMSSATNFGIFFGSGAPTLSAAQGSLYIRSDGSTNNNRLYVATSSTGAWTAASTVA